MSKAITLSIAVAGAGVVLFTALLTRGSIGEASYVALVGILALSCFAIPTLSRLRELNLRDLKLTLDRLEAVKEEIKQLYGGIDDIKASPTMVLDDEKIEDLGLKTGAVILGKASMRYLVGCMKRERERLARVFITGNGPDKLAEGILDSSMDDLVFKWNGPEAALDRLPKSVSQKLLEKNTGSSLGQQSGE